MKTTGILITGGCGYLGSALLSTAPQQPVRFRVLDNMSSGDYRAIMDLPDGVSVEFIEADILDAITTAEALRGIDTVLHLAAIVTTPVSFEHSRSMEQINHWGTVNLVNACIEAGVQRFVYASTSAVYGPGGPFTEEQACRPVGSYAGTLLNAEMAVRGATERGLRAHIMRFGMIYGTAPVMRFDNVIHRLIMNAGTGRTLSLFGDGTQKRPIIHVRDACNAISHVLDNQSLAQVLNIHTENVAVADIAAELQQQVPQVRTRHTEQDVLTHLSFEATNERMISGGWAPQVTMDQGIADLLRHFRRIQPLAGITDHI